MGIDSKKSSSQYGSRTRTPTSNYHIDITMAVDINKLSDDIPLELRVLSAGKDRTSERWFDSEGEMSKFLELIKSTFHRSGGSAVKNYTTVDRGYVQYDFYMKGIILYKVKVYRV